MLLYRHIPRRNSVYLRCSSKVQYRLLFVRGCQIRCNIGDVLHDLHLSDAAKEVGNKCAFDRTLEEVAADAWVRANLLNIVMVELR